VSFVRVQAETRWAPGFLVSFAEERVIIIVPPIQNAPSAKERENQAMDYPVRGAGAKDSIHNDK